MLAYSNVTLSVSNFVRAPGGSASVMRGQSPLDGFPERQRLVRVVVMQPDGKILIGGDFTTISPNGGAAVTGGLTCAPRR